MKSSVVGRSAFTALRANGRRYSHGPLRVTFLPVAGSAPRVAFALGRRFGPAVDRNRARRRLRPLVLGGLEERCLEGDLLVTCSRSVLELTFSELTLALSGLLDQIVDRQPVEQAGR